MEVYVHIVVACVFLLIIELEDVLYAVKQRRLILAATRKHFNSSTWKILNVCVWIVVTLAFPV